MGIGTRVRAEREGQGISRRELAAFAGIAPTTLSDLELELSQNTTALHKIAQRLGVRAEWLETGKGRKHPPETGDPDWDSVLGFAQSVGLGAGAEGQEYAETHKLKFRADSLARKGLQAGALAVMYGDGDSMLPRIKAGDAVLFDTSDTTERDGALYVILRHGLSDEYFVKRAMILDDVVYFAADNPEGDHRWKKPHRKDSKREPITTVGRVRWIGSWED